VPFAPLSRAGWTITASSTWDGSGTFAAAKAIDGDTATCWHSGPPGGSYPHYFVVDMGSAQTFSALQYVPRQEVYRNDPGQVELYVSDDGATWGSAIYTATWTSGLSAHTIEFATVTKRWFKFIGLNPASGADANNMACAEIYVGEISEITSGLLTQTAVEALTSGGSPNARLTQVAVERLVFFGATLTEEIRQTQEALEWAGTSPANADLRETQAAAEWAGTMPAASAVNATQAALEHVGFPPNDIWATQVCLEVLFPADEFPEPPEPIARRNWLYSGGLAHT
jgi:hypothetical protein